MDWVETTCSLVPEAAADLAALGRLYEGKLYHELTLALETFVNDPGHQGRGRLLLDLEQHFLSKFEGKLNQLRYALIFGAIVRASVEAGGTLSGPEGIAKLEGALEAKGARLGVEPGLLLRFDVALLKLAAPRGPDAAAELASVKAALDDAQPTMDALTGATDTAVFRKYYAARSEYYKQVGPPEAFYRSAISLLGSGREKSATCPTSKAHISAVFHPFRLILGRAIISRNGLEAWMLFPERARAEHSR